MSQFLAGNNARFVTEADNSYGFGVEHKYAHLASKYVSIYDELISNNLHRISERVLDMLFVKAVRIYHQIAINPKQRGNELKCKYYSDEYGLVRNQQIGIRQIFALVAYLDVTSFCTIFRATYRRLENETNANQVKKRHSEFYHYARSLYESIEFFGQLMPPTMKVYHGLNKVMYFEQFRAYFNQPISTTPSRTIAERFALKNGEGIVLTLKSGVSDSDDISKKPKFLDVAWLSAFQDEEEKLFYGEYVEFEIDNIIEAKTNTDHQTELKLFNLFQRLLQNYEIDDEWKKSMTPDMVNILTNLIRLHCSRHGGDDEYKSDDDNEHVTVYGRRLFEHFCNFKNKVTFNRFKTIPPALYRALFIGNHDRISLIPITSLFPQLTRIAFTYLNYNDLEKNIGHYINAVHHYITTSKDPNKSALLRANAAIVFESDARYGDKENVLLAEYEAKYSNEFTERGWKIQCETWRPSAGKTAARLLFSNETLHLLKSFDTKSMTQFVAFICKYTNSLTPYNEDLASYAREKQLSGKEFQRFKRKQFGQAVVDYAVEQMKETAPRKSAVDRTKQSKSRALAVDEVKEMESKSPTIERMKELDRQMKEIESKLRKLEPKKKEQTNKTKEADMKMKEQESKRMEYERMLKEVETELREAAMRLFDAINSGQYIQQYFNIVQDQQKREEEKHALEEQPRTGAVNAHQ